jgi:hypothetical protein
MAWQLPPLNALPGASAVYFTVALTAKQLRCTSGRHVTSLVLLDEGIVDVCDIMREPQLNRLHGTLQLTGLSVPDIAATNAC